MNIDCTHDNIQNYMYKNSEIGKEYTVEIKNFKSYKFMSSDDPKYAGVFGNNSEINYMIFPYKNKKSLLDIKDKLVDCLSGGQLQMVLLARALVCKSEYLALDKPESNLNLYHQLLQYVYEIADKVLLLKRNKEYSFVNVD